MLTEGFRPLAGISCVSYIASPFIFQTEFPSPRGDKLCQIMTATINPCTEFPSPRGDKLCRGLSSEPACPYCFRPLAGISCVEAVQISGLNNPVSVPSRG